jgi:hypothetical protein
MSALSRPSALILSIAFAAFLNGQTPLAITLQDALARARQ